jgi:hypothetical protein
MDTPSGTVERGSVTTVFLLVAPTGCIATESPATTITVRLATTAERFTRHCLSVHEVSHQSAVPTESGCTRRRRSSPSRERTHGETSTATPPTPIESTARTTGSWRSRRTPRRRRSTPSPDHSRIAGGPAGLRLDRLFAFARLPPTSLALAPPHLALLLLTRRSFGAAARCVAATWLLEFGHPHTLRARDKYTGYARASTVWQLVDALATIPERELSRIDDVDRAERCDQPDRDRCLIDSGVTFVCEQSRESRGIAS